MSKPDARHALDHRGGRRRGGHQAVHLVVDALAPLRRRVEQHRVHDRRAAVVRDLVLADEIEDRLRLDLAQAHVRAGRRGDRPVEAPAVAMEHRQRPQVHRVLRHRPVEDVVDRVQVRAAIVIHDALGIAGRARGVVERDRVPLVGRRRSTRIPDRLPRGRPRTRSRPRARRLRRARRPRRSRAASTSRAPAPWRSRRRTRGP